MKNVLANKTKGITRDEFIEYIDDEELTDKTIFLDNMDIAILGYSYNENGIIVMVYSREKLIQRTMELYDISETDADRWVQFNIEPICVGVDAPILVETL